MERVIEKVEFPVPQQVKAKRVAAYARVSAESDAMHHSLAAQVSFYSDFICKHPGWVYAGVFADEAKTGTKESREGFQKMLTDCRAGKIDMVLTKSISRFARNTVTLLEMVRELKSLGIDIFFEEQNIHTLSDSGELMLTILASFAQAESQSASENQKWRIKKNFEEGKPWNCTMLGYRYKDGELIVKPDEAAIVQRIFSEYLSGKGFVSICNGLNDDGIPTRWGDTWHKNSIVKILKNYAYTGNLLLQTTYRENYLSKRMLINNGELPQYHATETHIAIISLEAYTAVQAEMQRRAELFTHKKPASTHYDFTGCIVCAHCGKHYRRKVRTSGTIWVCATYNTRGKSACPSKAIPESILMQLTDGLKFDEITADDGNLIRVRSGDTETVLHWNDRSRAESWTEEMREQARDRLRSKKCQEQ